MTWASLRLWAEDEEKRIHNCILEALRRLISSRCVSVSDGELVVSGKLRPLLYRAKKELNLAWTLHPEASSFREEDTPKPIGHPDFRFSCNAPDGEQYDYDIECKLVRIKREKKSWDYCAHYVVDGIQRFHKGIYAQSSPPMGTMIGYIQEGEIFFLLDLVNDEAKKQKMKAIQSSSTTEKAGIIHFEQHIQRVRDDFVLTHFWADLRQ